MCDFKPGDEVVCVSNDGWDWDYFKMPVPVVGCRYTVTAVIPDAETAEHPEIAPSPALELAELRSDAGAYPPECFRKVERRNDSLSIESFLTIKPGFEEPKRTPARKAVDA